MCLHCQNWSHKSESDLCVYSREVLNKVLINVLFYHRFTPMRESLVRSCAALTILSHSGPVWLWYGWWVSITFDVTFQFFSFCWILICRDVEGELVSKVSFRLLQNYQWKNAEGRKYYIALSYYQHKRYVYTLVSYYFLCVLILFSVIMILRIF